MKRLALLAVLLCGGVIALAGCSGGGEQAPSEGATPASQEQESAPEEAAPVGDADTNAAASAGGVEDGGLAGSKWHIAGYILEFKDAPQVQISGDEVPIEGGVTGEYSIASDGAITVGAVGQSYTGTWDGKILVFEGIEATCTEGPWAASQG